MEAHSGKVEAHSGKVEAHSSKVEAHSGKVEAHSGKGGGAAAAAAGATEFEEASFSGGLSAAAPMDAVAVTGGMGDEGTAERGEGVEVDAAALFTS